MENVIFSSNFGAPPFKLQWQEFFMSIRSQLDILYLEKVMAITDIFKEFFRISN
jgi:hypothetical protein